MQPHKERQTYIRGSGDYVVEFFSLMALSEVRNTERGGKEREGLGDLVKGGLGQP